MIFSNHPMPGRPGSRRRIDANGSMVRVIRTDYGCRAYWVRLYPQMLGSVLEAVRLCERWGVTETGVFEAKNGTKTVVLAMNARADKPPMVAIRRFRPDGTRLVQFEMSGRELEALSLACQHVIDRQPMPQSAA